MIVRKPEFRTFASPVDPLQVRQILTPPNPFDTAKLSKIFYDAFALHATAFGITFPLTEAAG